MTAEDQTIALTWHKGGERKREPDSKPGRILPPIKAKLLAELPFSMRSMILIVLLVLVCASHDVQAIELQLSAQKATGTPCCVDTLRAGVCKAMYNRDHDRFAKQCRLNADFSFMQCCHSCHFNPDYFTALGAPVSRDIYREDAENLLLKFNPTICFDRHGTAFCEAFVTRSGAWSRSPVACQHSAFAFRVCKKTCGFCTATKPATVKYESKTAKNPKLCTPLY